MYFARCIIYTVVIQVAVIPYAGMLTRPTGSKPRPQMTKGQKGHEAKARGHEAKAKEK